MPRQTDFIYSARGLTISQRYHLHSLIWLFSSSLKFHLKLSFWTFSTFTGTPGVILISELSKKQLLDAFTNHTTSRYCRVGARVVIHFSKVESLSLTPNRKPCNCGQQWLSKTSCHKAVIPHLGKQQPLRYTYSVSFYSSSSSLSSS